MDICELSDTEVLIVALVHEYSCIPAVSKKNILVNQNFLTCMEKILNDPTRDGMQRGLQCISCDFLCTLFHS